MEYESQSVENISPKFQFFCKSFLNNLEFLNGQRIVLYKNGGGFSMQTYTHPSDLDASIPRGSALLVSQSIFYWIIAGRR